jgi:membrane protein YdbS with pleckstrin-like domain
MLPYQRLTNWILVAVLAFVSFFGLIPVILGGTLPGWATALLPIAWIAAIAALGPMLNRWSAAVYHHTSYRVGGDGLEIRRGVLWRKVINVPRTRVQHTDVSQGPLERAYGLGTLVVYTAGTEHARVSLPGLDHAVALRLRGELLAGGDDAV